MMTPDSLRSYARILRMAWRASGEWGAMFLEAAKALDFKANYLEGKVDDVRASSNYGHSSGNFGGEVRS